MDRGAEGDKGQGGSSKQTTMDNTDDSDRPPPPPPPPPLSSVALRCVCVPTVARCAAVHNGVKLPFEVVFASSADDGFDARQLEAPSKAAATPADPSQPQPQTHIKGWQSAKFVQHNGHTVR